MAKRKLEDLLVDLGSGDENVRKGAVIKLGAHQEPEALAALKSALLDEASSVRYYAKVSLQKMAGRFSPEEMAASVPLGEETRAGICAVLALKETMDPDALPRFLATKDPFVRATLAGLLCELGPAETRVGERALVDCAVILLDDPNPRVVANAVETIERWSHEPALEALKSLLFHEDARVKANVAKALFTFSVVKPDLRKLALARLREIIDHAKPWVRSSAVYALGAIGTAEAQAILKEVLADPEKLVREQAQEALKRLETGAPAPPAAAKAPAVKATAPPPAPAVVVTPVPTAPPIEAIPAPSEPQESKVAPPPAAKATAPSPSPAVVAPPEIVPAPSKPPEVKPAQPEEVKTPSPPPVQPAEVKITPSPASPPPPPAEEKKAAPPPVQPTNPASPPAAKSKHKTAAKLPPSPMAPSAAPAPPPPPPQVPKPAVVMGAVAPDENPAGTRAPAGEPPPAPAPHPARAKRAAVAVALLVLVAVSLPYIRGASKRPPATGETTTAKPARPGVATRPESPAAPLPAAANLAAPKGSPLETLREGMRALKRLDFDAADARFRALLAHAPDNKDFQGFVAVARFGQARAHLAAGRPAEAATALQEARTLKPLPGMPILETDIHLRSGDLPAALTAAESATREEPENAAAWHVLGLARLKAGQVEPAVDAFARAARIAPAIAKYRINHARVLLRAKRETEALAEALAGLRLQPGPAAYKLLLDAATEADRPGFSLVAFRELLRDRPDDPALLKSYTDLLLGLEMYHKALRNLEKLIKRAPADPDLHFKAALCHQAAGDLPAMKRHVEAAIKAKPDHFAARYAMGRIHAFEKRPADALREFAAALAARPDSEAAAVEVARIHMDARRYQPAYDALAALLARRKEAREAHLIAGQAALKLVRTDAAKAHFNLFLNLEPPESPRATLVRATLATLR